MKRLLGAVLPALVAACVAFSAAPCRAQATAWDQAKVTALAVQLHGVLGELQTAMRREGNPSMAQVQSRARHSFRDSLRVLRSETRALAAELEAGAGLEETWPIVRRARVVIRDLREEGRRMGWAEPAVGHARRAEELIAQIAPFYAGAEAQDAADATKAD
jgi:hypothetical protein